MQKKGAASRPKKAAVASRVHVCVCVCTLRPVDFCQTAGPPLVGHPSRYQKKELKKGQMVTGLDGTSL